MPRRDSSPGSNRRKDEELLTVLTNQHCRFVLTYFRNVSEDVASVEELATHFARHHDQADRKRVAIRLHHTILPRLAEHGIVNYDTSSETVRYRGHDELEEWHDHLTTEETEQNIEGD